jgi:hypothetical protein
MSDKSEAPGWWIASDGKWYPPELHPSVRNDSHPQASGQGAETSQPHRWQGQAEKGAHVGPQFPDLYQQALQGSRLADNVSVKYDGDDERNATGSSAGVRIGGGAPVAAGTVGVTIAAPAKRRWRKGR